MGDKVGGINVEIEKASLRLAKAHLVNCSYTHGHYIVMEEETYRCLEPCRDPNYTCSHVERLNMQRETLTLQKRILEALEGSAVKP